ncbi:MAG: vanadium-dependent haloperoxidase [Acidobacteriota bacterium]
MKNKDLNINKKSENENVPSERRKFLSRLGKVAVAGAAVGAIGVKPFIGGKSSEVAAQKNINVKSRRALKCYQLRVDAARKHFDSFTNEYHVNNNDEYLYENKIANFTKGLPHNSNGEVSLSAYNSLLTALRGTPADFEQIQMGGDRRLTNPLSGVAYDMEGADSQSFYIPPAPAFAGREIAAEIAENYWMALLRDVPYQDYANNPIAQSAAADLNIFGDDFKGAKTSNGQVTPNNLFRGLTPGDKAGPLISQFFYQPCSFGANEVSQRIRTVRGVNDGGRDYMTDFNSWLSVQNGISQSTDLYDPISRYIRNGRDMGQWVHVDVLFQAYFQAFLVLSNLNMPFDEANPYRNSRTQMGFATFGSPHIAALLCEVATRALKAVWFQKWYVHRRLRPEVFAARVHQTLYNNANYPVHTEILSSVSSSSRLGNYLNSGSALLPQAFPEGSPLHPSYGAGHATVAGACSTILKAFFDESAVIQNPLVPDSTGTTLVPYTGSETLTVGGELNKIASNVALGRNTAGVHWRSDGTESLKLGEELAISILRDQAGCYSEQFDGFSLTKFDGTTVTV